MEEQSFWERIGNALGEVSTQLGAGSGAGPVILILLVLALFVLGFGLIVFYSSSGRKDDDARAARLDGLLGRFERTERTVNEFRAEALRHLEISRTELESLRDEFEAIRTLLQEQVGRGVMEPELDRSLVVRRGRERRATREEFQPFSVERTATQIETKTSIEGAEEPSVVKHLEPEKEVPSARIAPESLSKRLTKTRVSFFDKIRSIFVGKPKLDEDSVDELEAILVSSDIGIKTASLLLEELKEDIQKGAEVTEGGVTGLLKRKLLNVLEQGTPRSPLIAPRRREDGPVVILVVGVNGVGKTTTVAKLAHNWKDEGSNVLMVAADTFRAAAVEQLHEWGRRLGIPVVSGASDAKPQTVVFDAMVRAQQEPIDVVIIDTAGRLHTKQNLMDELEGIRNAIQRHQSSAPDEVLLVLDGATGQNAVTQAREFNEATRLTGLVVTKLDGTSKGGVLVAIKEELGIPVRYIGVGEGKEDLRPFVPRDFVEALFDTSDSPVESSVNAEIRRRRRAEAV